MKITTFVIESGNDYTISKLFVNEIFQCYIIEDKIRVEKIKGITAIPRGTYEVIITMSNRFKKLLPLLLNVPNYEGVRIHAGNTSEDTEGCLLPGLNLAYIKNKRAVTDSRNAFEMLYKKIKSALDKGEKVTITLS